MGGYGKYKDDFMKRCTPKTGPMATTNLTPECNAEYVKMYTQFGKLGCTAPAPAATAAAPALFTTCSGYGKYKDDFMKRCTPKTGPMATTNLIPECNAEYVKMYTHFGKLGCTAPAPTA